MSTTQAGIYNITIEKRTSFAFTATFSQANGSALNLTNRTLSAQLRRDFDNALQADFTITKTDATKGIATVSLTSGQSAALTNDESHYDIFAIQSDGTSERLLQGKATIVDNITIT